ncbi:MAG: Asp-tRNA(Asn)/Glu-tRNA(Gln) amidotransferase subunit GatB, partial [Patescibacteria group bacterium]
MDKYIPTIGLEIHAELKTRTKMFCDCKNDSGEERPNVNICPVCLGHPGTLPVINREAVRSVLKVGAALGGRFATITEFDRKNYFYPDIPKGYQISQYKHPLVSGGELSRVKITKVHLEEDTGTSIHSSSFTKATADKEGEYSLVNFNRAGVPLMELVTEPVIHSAAEAVKFAKELQLLLQYLEVAEANMEKGEMRVETNISLAPRSPDGGGGKLGTKVEIKNLNSFKATEKAIIYETKRQSDLLEKGENVVQETRGWNEERGETFSQRQKEESHDYRYFPEPDLPRIDITKVFEFNRENILAALPATPQNKRENLSSEFGIKESDIEFYVNNILFMNFAEQIF